LKENIEPRQGRLSSTRRKREISITRFGADNKTNDADAPSALHTERYGVLYFLRRRSGKLEIYRKWRYTEAAMVPILLIWSGIGIAALRIALAAILIAHGLPKLKDIGKTAEWLGPLGFRPARFWAIILAALELCGGVLVLVGFLTQVIAIVIAIEFIVIILKVKLKKGLVDGYELDLIILAAAIALITLGSGAWSIDGFLHGAF
jgi:uncharacterized membrane protein YphA (DoxX/SURF4 family)